MVSDLMDLDTKSWNLDLINCIFLPFEAENIGGIPLKNWFPDDKQIWVVHIKLVQFVFAGEKLVEFVFEGNSLILVQAFCNNSLASSNIYCSSDLWGSRCFL